MRYSLAFACVLCSISGIEEAALNRDKCIVIVTALITGVSSVNMYRVDAAQLKYTACRAKFTIHSPFQPTACMAVDNRNSTRVCNADMIGLYADQWTIFLMRVINSKITTSTTALVEEPEIAERS